MVNRRAKTINRIDLIFPTVSISGDIIGIIIGGFEEPAVMT